MIFVLVRSNVDFDLTFQQEWLGVIGTNNLSISTIDAIFTITEFSTFPHFLKSSSLSLLNLLSILSIVSGSSILNLKN